MLNKENNPSAFKTAHRIKKTLFPNSKIIWRNDKLTLIPETANAKCHYINIYEDGSSTWYKPDGNILYISSE